MDYTSSNSYTTDGGTAQRMHLQAQATPTAVSDTDLNGLIWEALAAIKAGGLVPAAFDKTVPGTYTQLRDAIAIAVRVQSAAYASAGGTADALTGTYAPVVPALVNGLTLYVRAASANATTTPTFSPNGLVAKTIVKGNGLALVAGDIAGAGHWIELQYDLTLDKWIFLNPATGVNLLPLFGASKAASGYQKLPGGLIIQWGNLYPVSTAYSNFTLPIAFPNACLVVLATHANGTAAATQPVDVGSYSTTVVPIKTAGATTVGAYILAIGF